MTLVPGTVYLTTRKDDDNQTVQHFSLWNGTVWMTESEYATGAERMVTVSAFQERTAVRPAQPNEIV